MNLAELERVTWGVRSGVGCLCTPQAWTGKRQFQEGVLSGCDLGLCVCVCEFLCMCVWWWEAALGQLEKGGIRPTQNWFLVLQFCFHPNRGLRDTCVMRMKQK